MHRMTTTRLIDFVAIFLCLFAAAVPPARAEVTAAQRELLAKRLPHLARLLADEKPIKLFCAGNCGQEKVLADALAEELRSKLGAEKVTPESAVYMNAAVAAWSAAGDAQRVKPDLAVLCFALAERPTRELLDDVVASCAHAAGQFHKAGADVLVLVAVIEPADPASGRAEAARIAGELACLLRPAVEPAGAVVSEVAPARGAGGAAPAGGGPSREVQACLRAMIEPAGPGELDLSARAEWTPRGVAIHLTARNDGAAPAKGRLTLSTFGRAQIEPTDRLEYALAGGTSTAAQFLLPDLRRPEVAVNDPLLRAVLADGPVELLLGRDAPAASVGHVRAYFHPLTAWVERTREVVSEGRLPLRLRLRNASAAPIMAHVTANLAGRATARPSQEVLPLPASSSILCPSLTVPLEAAALVGGSVQAVVEVRNGGGNPVYALAEAALLRFGQCAYITNPRIDGELGEWEGRVFARLRGQGGDGEAGQLEFTSGWDDDHFYLAVRTTKDSAAGDRLSLLLDARPAAELGTCGGGTHLQAMLEADGKLTLLGRGRDKPLEGRGAWKAAGDGWTLELAVPRSLLGLFEKAWPTDRDDLGFNLIWMDQQGQTWRRTAWCAGGEDWSSRTCGLARRSKSMTTKPTLSQLPVLVRWR